MTVLDLVAAELGIPVLVLVVLLIWSFSWKGFALWRCGRNNHSTWFVFILLLNTLGLLPIIYLLFFQPKRKVVRRKIRRHHSRI